MIFIAEKMWNISTNGFYNPFGLFGAQKRGYHGMSQFGNLNIVPNKSFTNPNYVNNYPTINAFEKYDVKSVTLVENSCKILDTIKKTHPEIIEKSESKPIEICASSLPGKNSRRRRRRRKYSENKNKSNLNEIIASEMDVEIDFNISDNTIDINFSPKPLHLFDFMEGKMGSMDTNEDNIPSGNVKQSIAFSITPPNHCGKFRDRQVSVCESEDSYVVFESTSEDECEFSGTTDTDEDTEESDSESELDSSSSVIPNKRVRFAVDSDLCEIHPMIQWAYAYQAARKGPWEVYARDRERFKKRIGDTEEILRPVFDKQHRDVIFKDRFM